MKAVVAIAVLVVAIAGCSGAPAPTGTSFPTLAPTPTAGTTASPVAPTASATASASVSAVPTGGELDAWRVGANQYFGRIGETFPFECPPGGEAFTVWGTDIYTSDSSVCTAAVHAGLITFAQGGEVTIEMLEGQESYAGTTRNGVETRSYPSYSGSYRFVGSDGPGGTPSASPSASPGSGLTEIFSDDFSNSSSGWGVGPVGPGAIAYVDGALEMTMPATTDTAQSLWSRRLFAAGPFSATRLEGDITVDEQGIAGLLCGSDDDEFHGMLLSTDGRWFAIRIAGATAGGDLSVLEQGTLEEELFTADQATRMVVACAVVDGQLNMGLAAGDPGTQVAFFVGDTDVTGFDRATVYAEPLATPYTQRVDDVVAEGGDAPQNPLLTELMEHVPATYHPQCDETPPSAAEEGALIAVACFVQQSGSPGAEIIEYVLFDSADSMDAAYDQRLASWGGESTGDTCQEGPAESTYSIGDQQIGRVFCGAQTSGIRIDWSDSRVNILTSATDFDGSYPDLYQTWQVAGPNP